MSWYNPKYFITKIVLLYFLMILIVALIVFIMAIGITGKLKDNTLTSRKIDLTQEMVDGLTSVIQLKGFHCPEVKLAYQRDPDVYGLTPRSGVVPRVQMMFMKKQCLESPLHQNMTRRSHLLDIRVVPWTDEIS